jgi:hypothetical protein
MKRMECHTELLEIVAAENLAGRLPGCLHSRQKQADENAYDGDDDQDLDERQAGFIGVCHRACLYLLPREDRILTRPKRE